MESLRLNKYLTTKQKEQMELLDLFDSLFKEHVVLESRQGVFLVLIFKLNFRPFQCNLEFVEKK